MSKKGYVVFVMGGAYNSDEVYTSQADAEAAADESIGYTQSNVYVRDTDGNNISVRQWYGTEYDEESDYNDDWRGEPIFFGSFGFYSGWLDC